MRLVHGKGRGTSEKGQRSTKGEVKKKINPCHAQWNQPIGLYQQASGVRGVIDDDNKNRKKERIRKEKGPKLYKKKRLVRLTQTKKKPKQTKKRKNQEQTTK